MRLLQYLVAIIKCTVTKVSIKEKKIVVNISCETEYFHRNRPSHSFNIRGVTGGTDQTSGGCSLCYTVPI